MSTGENKTSFVEIKQFIRGLEARQDTLNKCLSFREMSRQPCRDTQMFSKGWDITALVTPWLFLQSHQQVKVVMYPVKYLDFYCMNWHKSLHWHSWFADYMKDLNTELFLLHNQHAVLYLTDAICGMCNVPRTWLLLHNWVQIPCSPQGYALVMPFSTFTAGQNLNSNYISPA